MSVRAWFQTTLIACLVLSALWGLIEYFYVRGIREGVESGEVVSTRLYSVGGRGRAVRKARVELDSGRHIEALDPCQLRAGDRAELVVYRPLPFRYRNFRIRCD